MTKRTLPVGPGGNFRGTVSFVLRLLLKVPDGTRHQGDLLVFGANTEGRVVTHLCWSDLVVITLRVLSSLCRPRVSVCLPTSLSKDMFMAPDPFVVLFGA